MKIINTIDDKTMHLPNLCKLSGRNKFTPFIFVADDAISFLLF